MNQHTRGTVSIVGAGLAGAFLAIVLGKRGFTVDVYERYSESDTLDRSSKRSFNLTFYGYGIEAIKQAGVWEYVSPILLELEQSATQVTPQGTYIFSKFEGTTSYYAVERARLLQALVSAAKAEPNVTIHFETSVVSIDCDAKTISIESPSLKKHKTIKTDIVFGADGAHSFVRDVIQEKQPGRHSKIYAEWIYRQVAFTQEMANLLGLKPQTAYAWTRKNASFFGFPQLGGMFGALLMLPKNRQHGFEGFKTPQDVKTFVNTQFPSLNPVADHIAKEVLKNPDGSFVTICTDPWYYKDFLAILGDAAHGFYPFYGMGAATAFSDCMTLAHLVDEAQREWSQILPRYQEARKPNADVVAELSRETLARFTRSTKADPAVIYDRLEQVLHRMFPRYVRPPIFYSVAHDPNSAYKHYLAHKTQRRRLNMMGASFAVLCVAFLVTLKERLKV